MLIIPDDCSFSYYNQLMGYVTKEANNGALTNDSYLYPTELGSSVISGTNNYITCFRIFAVKYEGYGDDNVFVQLKNTGGTYKATKLTMTHPKFSGSASGTPSYLSYGFNLYDDSGSSGFLSNVCTYWYENILKEDRFYLTWS